MPLNETTSCTQSIRLRAAVAPTEDSSDLVLVWRWLRNSQGQVSHQLRPPTHYKKLVEVSKSERRPTNHNPLERVFIKVANQLPRDHLELRPCPDKFSALSKM